MSMTPTTEQTAALDLFATGESLVIEAGAGTGKTSTIQMIAEATPNRRGQFMAFNKAITEEASRRFPSTVACNTVHSLAYRAHGKKFSHRLRGSARKKSWEIADLLGIEDYNVTVDGQVKRLPRALLAGAVMDAVKNFCSSGDPEPGFRHFQALTGIDLPDAEGKATWDNNNEVRRYLEPFLGKAWADLLSPNGRLTYDHAHYLKAWALNEPHIAADYLLIDESQDITGVMLSIIEAQEHAQRCFVGDSQQELYAWAGAINAMARQQGLRTFLTQSFRFGPAVADLANKVLALLEAPLRLKGLESIDSSIGDVADPRAILCRTNAGVIDALMVGLAQGRKVHVMGGGKDVLAFARGAKDLMQGRSTSHRDLACFSTWAEVQEYVQADLQGDELRLLVTLVDRFGVDSIIQALQGIVSEAQADLVLSTGHKAKGREWDTVRLHADFIPSNPARLEDPAELRLLYVAATRAKYRLDPNNHPILVGA